MWCTDDGALPVHKSSTSGSGSSGLASFAGPSITLEPGFEHSLQLSPIAVYQITFEYSEGSGPACNSNGICTVTNVFGPLLFSNQLTDTRVFSIVFPRLLGNIGGDYGFTFLVSNNNNQVRSYSLSQEGYSLSFEMNPSEVATMTFWYYSGSAAAAAGAYSSSAVSALGYIWVTGDGRIPSGLSAYNYISTQTLANLVLN